MTKIINVSHEDMETSLFTYAAGYYDSGMILIDVLLDENRYSQLSHLMEEFRIESIKLEEEYNIYPVMFLFRQYMELIIKAMYLYFDINNTNYYNCHKKLFENHKISDIWPGLMKKLLEEEIDEDEYGITKILNDIVNKFISIDNDSYCFRYPIDKNSNFYLKKDEKYNLEEIRSDIRLFDELLHEFM